MQNVFTTFPAGRFIDQRAVVEALRRIAENLKERRSEVVSVYLFGSFAEGTATPRSDADLVIEIADSANGLRDFIDEEANKAFLKAPVPIDMFVYPSSRIAEDRRAGTGVIGAALKRGIRLA